MQAGHRTRSGLGQGARFFALLVLAYALILRAVVLPAGAAPAGSLDALFSDPHVLCLSQPAGDDSDGVGHPVSLPDHCGDCCLVHARAVLPAATVRFIAVRWPEIVASSEIFAVDYAPRGPPDEAWSPVRAQRGPPGMPIQTI